MDQHIMEMMMAQMMESEGSSGRKRVRRSTQGDEGAIKEWHEGFSGGQASRRRGYDWMLDAFRLMVEDASEEGDLIGGYADEAMGKMKSCPEAKALFKDFCSGAKDAGLLPSWWDQNTMKTIALSKEKGGSIPNVAIAMDYSSINKKWGRSSVMQMRMLAKEAVDMDDSTDDDDDWDDQEDWGDQFEEEEEKKPCAANNYFPSSFVEEVVEVPASPHRDSTRDIHAPSNIVYQCSSGLGLTEGVLSVEQLKKMYFSRKRASIIKKEKIVKPHEEQKHVTREERRRCETVKKGPSLTKAQQAEEERKRIMEDLLAEDAKKKMSKKGGGKRKK